MSYFGMLKSKEKYWDGWKCSKMSENLFLLKSIQNIFISWWILLLIYKFLSRVFMLHNNLYSRFWDILKNKQNYKAVFVLLFIN
jgi:hypothetical protein